MVFLWLIGILLLTTVILVTYKQRFSRIGRLAAKIPGPQLAFLSGNALDFGRNPAEFFNGFLQDTNKYGSVIRYWVGTKLCVLNSDPRDIKFFLSSTSILKKTEGYDFLDPWLGTGLITGDGGPKWHAHRKMLTPAFHFKILEGFMDVFNKNTNILIKLLKSEAGKSGFDIEPYISNLTLDVVCESAMGTPVNAQLQQSHSKFAEAIKEVTIATMCRTFKVWLYPDLLFNVSTVGRSFNYHVKYILDFVDEVIGKKKKLHEEKKLKMVESENHSDGYDQPKKYAFLDLMLQYRDVDNTIFSDVDIRNEVNTFMFAGQDTTASAISFALYELAKHPDIQEAVVQELNEIFSGTDREETHQDLQNMKYLERVIKETLRVYTTVPIIGRKLTHDVTVPSGYTIPEGTTVLIFLYKLHQNPEIYPNPEEFNPDNFLIENVQSRDPFAYCPFSAGLRNCIGQKFAMLEMKSTLSSVLRNYRLLPCQSGPNVLLSSEVVLRSTTGVHIRIEKRG